MAMTPKNLNGPNPYQRMMGILGDPTIREPARWTDSGQEIRPIPAQEMCGADGALLAIRGPDGKHRDEEGNLLDLRELRGKLMNGLCGHPGCACEPASMFNNDTGLFVCATCAQELNDRAGRIHGRDYCPPCSAPPA
jgi:hypothetical protein